MLILFLALKEKSWPVFNLSLSNFSPCRKLQLSLQCWWHIFIAVLHTQMITLCFCISEWLSNTSSWVNHCQLKVSTTKTKTKVTNVSSLSHFYFRISPLIACRQSEHWRSSCALHSIPYHNSWLGQVLQRSSAHKMGTLHWSQTLPVFMDACSPFTWTASLYTENINPL